MKTNPNIKTSWDLSPLFKSDTDPAIERERREVRKASQQFVKKWGRRTDYLRDPKAMLAALNDYDSFMRRYGFGGKQSIYFDLRSSVDLSNPLLKAHENKAKDLAIETESDLRFFTLNIGAIEPKLQKRFLDSPILSKYRHFLEIEFKHGKYNLSEKEEKILDLASKAAYDNWIRLTGSFLAKIEVEALDENGKKKSLTFTQIAPLTSHPTKKIRDNAAAAVNQITRQLVDIAEAELNSVLENKKTDDLLRKTDRPDAISHLDDDVESKTVDALLDAVSSRYDIPARFYSLLARMLGQKKLAYHERQVNFGTSKGGYPFDKTVQLVTKTFQQLDPDFAEIFKNYVSNGQVDVYPYKNKRNGAFCAWPDNSLTDCPTYVFLNHANKLDDVLTVAHEFGHAINSEYMRRALNALNFSSPVSVTEVASTFMEDFVLEEVLKDADDELRLSVLTKKIQEEIGSVFTQVAEYRFEQELHNRFRRQGYLSAKEIGELFREKMTACNGPAVEMTADNQNWWIQWNHIRYYFYVYSYVSGLLISKALQKRVRENPKFIAKIKDFLSAGSSLSPREIFLRMGIDINDKNFWKQGLEEIDKELEEITALAKKLGKI